MCTVRPRLKRANVESKRHNQRHFIKQNVDRLCNVETFILKSQKKFSVQTFDQEKYEVIVERESA